MPTGTHEQPKLAYVLAHVATGVQINGEMPLFGVDSSQSHGSAITYGRRYAKVAVLDLIADEDDDGAAASARDSGRSGADPGRDTVDMRDRAKGLQDAAINAARESVGLPRLDKPWGSLAASRPRSRRTSRRRSTPRGRRNDPDEATCRDRHALATSARQDALDRQAVHRADRIAELVAEEPKLAGRNVIVRRAFVSFTDLRTKYEEAT